MKGGTDAARASTNRRQAPSRPPADFVARLFAGEPISAIADVCGVHRNTVASWAGLPDVVAELATLRAERQAASLRALEGIQTKAIGTLLGILDTSTEPIPCRCGKGAACCSACGRPIERVAAPEAVQVRAVELVLDRTGLPKREQVEHIAPPTEGEATPSQTREAILDAAADIFQAEGKVELAADIRRERIRVVAA